MSRELKRSKATGRAVVALAADPKALRKTGRLLWASDLTVEYGLH